MSAHRCLRVVVTCSLALIAFVGVASTARAGAKVYLGDDKEKWLDVGVLLQPQFLFSEEARATAKDPDKTGWLLDPRIRRTRIMLTGQLGPKVNFFLETDQPNIGYKGDWSPSTFIQDAFMEFNVDEWLQVDVGMLLVGLGHHGTQGATSLLDVDYHVDLVKHPGAAVAQNRTANKPSNLVWRDVGILFRGLLLDKSLEYRLWITNGVQRFADAVDATATPAQTPRRKVNNSDLPRVTARLTYNLFESESGPTVAGLFWDGLYLKADGDKLVSPKKIVSLGVTGSYQAKTHWNTRPERDEQLENYGAFAADVFVDMPMNEDRTQALNAQINFYSYMFGYRSQSSGVGVAAEAGFRVDRWEPIIAIVWFKATDNDVVLNDADPNTKLGGDILAIRGGVAWWWMGLNANIKAQIGGRKFDDGKKVTNDKGEKVDNDQFILTGVVQTQFLF